MSSKSETKVYRLVLGFSAQSELNFYLVKEGLKPAAILPLNYKELTQAYSLPSKRVTGGGLCVGKNRKCLDNLVLAIEKVMKEGRGTNIKAIGDALGYPAAAVNNYKKKTNIEKGDIAASLPFYRHLADLIESNKKIPAYFAYMLFIPEPESFSSRSPSVKYAERIMEHVRKNNPSLSKAVEAEFADKVKRFLNLPTNFRVKLSSEY